VIRSLLAAILAGCFVAVPSTTAFAFEQANISSASATVTVVPGTAEVVVHLLNEGKVPLEAWDLRIAYELADGTHKVTEVGIDTSSDESDPATPGRGAIQPGEIRDRRHVLRLDGEVLSASVIIQMLILEDGTVEGDAGFAKSVFSSRERHAKLLGVWLEALNAASEVSVQEARTVLGRSLESEARRIKVAGGNADGQAEYQRMAWLLASPDDVLQSRIALIKTMMQRVYDRQARHIRR